MAKFRKKPVVIEAAQWTGDVSGAKALSDMARDSDRTVLQFEMDGVINVHTLEGVMQARIGDWIIRGVKGEFYPCKPDIFAATYEAVE